VQDSGSSKAKKQQIKTHQSVVCTILIKMKLGISLQLYSIFNEIQYVNKKNVKASVFFYGIPIARRNKKGFENRW